MARFANSVLFLPTGGGTTDFTVSTAVQGYMTPALAGAPTGVYKYRAESADLSQWEIGEGTYTSGTTVLTRTTVLYNSSGSGTGAGQSGAGTKINFSTTPQVGIVLATEDVLGIDQVNAWSAAQRAQARSNMSAALKGQIFGLILSTAGGSGTFSTAAGEAADSTGVDLMVLGSAFNKGTAAWAVGSGNGALDTGTLTNTWYHVFLIKRPDTGVVDVLFSVSATAPTLPTNYTLFRRIGSMKLESSAWRKFFQVGDQFLWDVSLADINTAVQSTTAILYALTTPPGVKTRAMIRGYMSNSTTGIAVLLSSPDESDQACTGSNLSLGATQATGQAAGGNLEILTNTSSQIRGRANGASTSLAINTYGWIDTRGRLE